MIMQSIDIAPRYISYGNEEDMNIFEYKAALYCPYLFLNDIFRKGGQFKLKKRLFNNALADFPREYFLAFNG